MPFLMYLCPNLYENSHDREGYILKYYPEKIHIGNLFFTWHLILSLPHKLKIKMLTNYYRKALYKMILQFIVEKYKVSIKRQLVEKSSNTFLDYLF